MQELNRPQGIQIKSYEERNPFICLYSAMNLKPLSVREYVLFSSLSFDSLMNSLPRSSLRYSFSISFERFALYMIWVGFALPSLSRNIKRQSCSLQSLQISCFISPQSSLTN